MKALETNATLTPEQQADIDAMIAQHAERVDLEMQKFRTLNRSN